MNGSTAQHLMTMKVNTMNITPPARWPIKAPDAKAVRAALSDRPPFRVHERAERHAQQRRLRFRPILAGMLDVGNVSGQRRVVGRRLSVPAERLLSALSARLQSKACSAPVSGSHHSLRS